MYNFIQKFHSGWAYLALFLLTIAVLNAAVGLFSKKEFKPLDRKIALAGFLASHIQLLMGILVYFLSPIGFALLGNMDKEARLTSLEHPLINIIAIVLITIGWSKHKKALSDGAKFKAIALFFGIGLVLILSRIPWKMWL